MPQDETACLWILATPIGNLGDLSPRARETLERVTVVLCEDTRRTRTLLQALAIRLREGARLERLDAHAKASDIEHWVGRLQAGDSLALVTDAGTPAVSDPGAALVAQAREAGFAVIPIPGPSAVTALLSASGFTSTRFAFHGFFPRGVKEAERELERIQSASDASHVWFESPKRIGKTTGQIAAVLPEARVVVGKELTKIHERIFAGNTVEVAAEIAAELEREGELGEWTFAIQLANLAKPTPTISESSDWVKALRCLLDSRIPAPEAAKRVSQYFGVARKIVYAEAVALGDKKNFRRD